MPYNPAPKKSLGQHWLNDQDSLDAMAKAADVQASDTILEIGPGLGSLTKVLLEQADQVIAVEFDQILGNQLPQRLQSNRLKVIIQDILSLDFTELPDRYKVVANIPYYLTSNLIRVISETSNPPEVAVLLVQKEVAQRVTALPGAMSLLSVSAQYYWEVSLGQAVPAVLFTPPPKVDSQILVLQRRSKPLFDDVEPKQFFRVVKAGFAQRRKTLLNSLSAGLRIERATAQMACDSVGIDPKRRAQTLSLQEWYNLYLSLQI